VTRKAKKSDVVTGVIMYEACSDDQLLDMIAKATSHLQSRRAVVNGHPITKQLRAWAERVKDAETRGK
jgi:hypothetical protein